jgi:Arc/MetJ-type ribon-helix-helix transcriptional regulator
MVKRARMTNVIRSAEMAADNAISVRLDAEALRALEWLTGRGDSTRSEAIRQALVQTAREARRKQVRDDAERIGNDPVDRALVAEIRDFFDELAPPG